MIHMKPANSIQLNDCSSYNRVQCCNGVFFFTKQEERYVLWNPSNGTSTEVGFPDLPSIESVGSIGYDNLNDDYKIACSKITKHSVAKTLQVYSLKNDSWKTFNGEFPPGYGYSGYGYSSTHPCWHGICVSSVMYWLWENPENSLSSRWFIAAFDFETESFRSLPLPEKPGRLGMKPKFLKDFGGRLCVAYNPIRKDEHGGCDVHRAWVMENYRVGRSWTPLYTNWVPHHFYYFPNKKRRLLCNYSGLSWCDPHDHSDDHSDEDSDDHSDGDIQVEGYPNKDHWYRSQCVVYVRNLVRLDKKLI